MKLAWIANRAFCITVLVVRPIKSFAFGGLVFCSSEKRAEEMAYTAAAERFPDAGRRDMIVEVREVDLDQLSRFVEVAP